MTKAAINTAIEQPLISTLWAPTASEYIALEFILVKVHPSQ
jgi:hypothetical protein